MNKAKSNGDEIVKFGEFLLLRLDNFSFNPLQGEMENFRASPVVRLFVLAESCWGQGRGRRSTQDLAGARTVAGSGRLSTESQVSTGSHRIENVHKPPVLEEDTGAGSKLSRLSGWPGSLVTEIYTCNFQATCNKKEKKRRHSLSRIKTGHGNKNT